MTVEEQKQLKEAYETLGLPEFSPREEVEKRYTTLMRRERARARQTGDESASHPERAGGDFSAITEAYRFILNYEERKAAEEFNRQEYGKYGNMADKAQKLDHFWRYYKFHTLGAIVLIAAIIYGINSYIDHREHQKYLASLPPIDVSVSFFGMFIQEDGQNDSAPLNAAMLQSFPDWQRIESNIIFIPQDDAQQFAYLQKALVTLATEVPDIYLMDRAMFEYIGRQEVLMRLDDEALVHEADEELLLKLQVARDDRGEFLPDAPAYIYGVDLGNSQLASDLPLMRVDLIAGIRANAANPGKALQFIETYLQTVPQP